MEIATARRLWDRGRNLPVWVFDSVLTVTMLLIAGLSVTGSAPDPSVSYEPLDWRGWLLVLIVTVPYVARRTFPFAVFALSAVAVVTFTAMGYYEGVLPTVVLVGTYTIGAYCRPRQVVAGYALVLGLLLALLVLDVATFDAGEFAANAAFFGVAVLFGWTVQARRLRLEASEERATLLEREQEEERARAVADERLRIAQELHDVVAHSMSVIAVQAGVGMHVVDADPVEARRALENISTTSRSTLTELRRLLGVLRQEESSAAVVPSPGLRDLGGLVRELDQAGVAVDVALDGSLDDVPPGVDLTGYRIVQEALTNVLKHAGPSRVAVEVRHRLGVLRLEVRDDGRGVNGSSDGSGHGLMGMRERVAVYGGRLEAGPQPGGGFRVVAELPYDERAEMAVEAP